jgi:hypothetical protein
MHHATYISEGEQSAKHCVAGFAIIFADHLWHVIRSHWSIKANLAVCAHRFSHICLPIVLPAFPEVISSTDNISVMNVSNVRP